MPFRTVQQGINAIQAGNVEEGARLLKIALKNPDLTGMHRAVACMWMAEITADPQAKRGFYEDARTADPNNAEIRQRVDSFLATQWLPPATSGRSTSTGSFSAVNPNALASSPPQPTSLPGNPFAPVVPATLPQTGPLGRSAQPNPAAAMYQMAAVMGGPRGPGTAFFVAREGLLATSRYVVGTLEQVTIELQAGRQLTGQVVRSYPEYDLSFIYVDQTVTDLLPPTPLPRIPDDTPITALSYKGQAATGRRRATKRVIAPQWFPTDIRNLPDAGGGPVLDSQNYLLGMITRDTSSTSPDMYGLHIHTIRTLVETFRQETMQGAGVYCPHCGFFSRAGMAGGHYCEACGGVMPQAEGLSHFLQPQTQRLYWEYSRIPCPHCNATVGFHKNVCLRCGQAVG